MIDSTLFHFSCGHSMNQKADDDVCPLCQAGILTGQQWVSVMPGDWLSHLDTFSGRKQRGSKVTHMPISKSKMEGD